MTRSRLLTNRAEWSTMKDIQIAANRSSHMVGKAFRAGEISDTYAVLGHMRLVPKADADKWIAENKVDKPRAFLTPLEPKKKQVCPPSPFHGKKKN